MKGMADVIHFETLHYTKHLMRGWWQEQRIERQGRYYFYCSRPQVEDLPAKQTREYVRTLWKERNECFRSRGAMIWQKNGKEGYFTW